MKFQKTLLFVLVIALFTGCSPKILKYTKKPDDVVTTDALKGFLATNKNPKVVLRVNNSSYSVTEDENIDYLFNAIENELLASGFTVRDRQLFNQIVGNDDNTIDYEVLKNKTDTDLIIELTALNPSIEYTTNKYYQSDKEKVSKYTKYKRYGAMVEFKVVLIQSNEFAGIYRFNYTPCIDGCALTKVIKKKRKRDEPKPYEGVERNELEEFIKAATRDLVAEMRK